MGGTIPRAGVLVWAVPFHGLGSLHGWYYPVGWGPFMVGTIPWAGVPVWVAPSMAWGPWQDKKEEAN